MAITRKCHRGMQLLNRQSRDFERNKSISILTRANYFKKARSARDTRIGRPHRNFRCRTFFSSRFGFEIFRKDHYEKILLNSHGPSALTLVSPTRQRLFIQNLGRTIQNKRIKVSFARPFRSECAQTVTSAMKNPIPKMVKRYHSKL